MKRISGRWVTIAASAIMFGAGQGALLGQEVEEGASFVNAEEAPAEAATPQATGDFCSECGNECESCFQTTQRQRFQSDHCFDDFSHPVSNPVWAKDPRASTHVRFLFINNWTPNTHAVIPNAQFQVYAMQVNVALTERLVLMAGKDGYAVVNDGPLSEGWLNLALGLKYAFIRRPQDQLVVSAGLTYEIPSGEIDVLQGYGAGLVTPYIAGGKGWGDFHTISNIGYVAPVNKDFNSSYFYWQQHFDYRLTDWIAPIAEFNWFHYTSGGDHGLPQAVGEGNGLLNLGTSGMAGADLVTVALGARIHPANWLSTGITWETPLSNREDLIDHRINLDVILRY